MNKSQVHCEAIKKQATPATTIKKKESKKLEKKI